MLHAYLYKFRLHLVEAEDFTLIHWRVNLRAMNNLNSDRDIRSIASQEVVPHGVVENFNLVSRRSLILWQNPLRDLPQVYENPLTTLTARPRPICIMGMRHTASH